MRAFLSLCLLFILPASAHCNDVAVGQYPSQLRGALYTFNLTQPALTKAPHWKAGVDFPPLSPRKAQEIALAQAKSLFPEVTNWDLGGIALEPVGEDDWVYVVTYLDLSPPLGGKRGSLSLPVYFDGSTIKPTVEKLGP